MQFNAKMNSMIARTIKSQVSAYLQSDNKGKALFIWGPRRSGKTTLLEEVSRKYKTTIYNFDSYSDREKFTPDRDILSKMATENRVILIDEIQNYPEATLAVKILLDNFNVKIIATGSSELRRTSKDFDSLAGRYEEIFCLPLSAEEIKNYSAPKPSEEKRFNKKMAQDIILYGAYPEVYLENSSEEAKIDLLQKLLNSYVLKDVIDIYNLKNSKLAKDILTKIALQIGNEVSIREIANSLQANITTVANYIEIFIKNYILIPLPSFKTNLRRAVSENRKLFFYDLGIRNVLVRDFRPMELRPDKGGVWENFIVCEIEKQRKIYNFLRTLYFYREYGGKEVDLVIEDYKKRYVCAEIKTIRGKVKNIFPLPHKQLTINQDDFMQKITEVWL
ncbi:MAG: ATP-binding protein [bacterium]|nr:ATP-binding protein [bacterium]